MIDVSDHPLEGCRGTSKASGGRGTLWVGYGYPSFHDGMDGMDGYNLSIVILMELVFSDGILQYIFH